MTPSRYVGTFLRLDVASGDKLSEGRVVRAILRQTEMVMDISATEGEIALRLTDTQGALKGEATIDRHRDVKITGQLDFTVEGRTLVRGTWGDDLTLWICSLTPVEDFGDEPAPAKA